MSSSTAAASGEASHGAINSHRGDKSPSDGDEEIVGMSLAVTVGSSDGGISGGLEPEILDPAILAMSVEGRTTHRPYQYSKDRLLELRDAPASRQRPDYLDPTHNNSQGLWDPERWHHDWKRAETPSENASRDQPPENHKRRSGDPRERIRKEQDGIVLSPQRRSFNSGCFVPITQAQPRTGRPDSPLGNKTEQHLGHREISQGARRIGSGRIIARDVSWDYRPDKSDLDGPEYGFGRPGSNSGPGRERKDTDRDREDRFDRRSFGRDFERDRDRDKDRHITRNGRYNDRRRISDSKDDEPEWFSGGPTSQHDTIELRGFDESTDERLAPANGGRKKQSPSQKKRNKERPITKTNNDSGSKEESPKGPGARSTPTPSDGPNAQCGPAPHSPIAEEQPQQLSDQENRPDVPSDMSTTSVPEPPSNSVPALPMDFNLEDFLKMDSIPELLTNGAGNDVGSSAGSRFSRWFNIETSPVPQDSRRSSLQDDHLVNNIINGLGDSDTYFAPISPAASTGGTLGVAGSAAGPPPGAKPVTLLEMLQRGKQAQQQKVQPPSAAVAPPVLKNMDVSGKLLCLDEIEAGMRQGNERSQEIQTGGPPGSNLNRSKQEDMTAFKRLLAQVTGGQAIPASNGPIPHKPTVQQQQQPMSLLQMLNKSQQEDARAAAMASAQQQHHNMLGSPSPGGPPGPHVPSDLVLKLHQVQQHQQRQHQAEMMSKLMNSNNRQQQFGAGAAATMTSHPPEMTAQALAGPGRELLQRPEAVAILQAGMQQRIPSPRELQAHTQNIMQRALIKKKLEEQQENFRKKQEMQQRAQSPAVSAAIVPGVAPVSISGTTGASPAKHLSSPTPLAFTPTSVLRKMTAEKEGETLPNAITKDSALKSQQITNENNHQPIKAPQGRAVTGMRQPPIQPPTNQQLPPQQPLQPPNNWNIQPPQQQSLKQPVGRPIVKGNNNYQQYMPQEYQQMQQQMSQQQQQHQRNIFQQQQQQQRVKLGPNQQQYNMQNRVALQQQQQNQMRNQLHNLQLQQHQRGNAWHQMMAGQNYDNRGIPVTGRGMQMGRGSPCDGDLSPTSDQLARWFSPELLAQARAGKLPDMPPAGIAQNALSLEELERIQQSTAPVHN